MIFAVSQLRAVIVCSAVLALTTVVPAESTLKESPFLPAAGAGPQGKAAAPTYELAGMSVAGKATLLSIIRVADKRSIWVAVGQTVGEVTAVSFDPKTDEATIRANGKLLTLGLKKSAVVTGPAARVPVSQPTVSATPPKPQPVSIPPPPANVQEEKETEARMLVTDLLEIGQEQRRAYEEAQKQAAAKSGKSTTSTPKR